MIITFFDGTKTVPVENTEALLEMVKSEQINKNSRVYDVYAGQYTTLKDVEAVKEMAMNPNYNQYLCMDINRIVLKKKDEIASKRYYNVISLVSLSIIVIGVVLRIIGIYNSNNLFSNSDRFLSGSLVGAMIGRFVIFLFVWLVVWKWYKTSQRVLAAITLILISALYLGLGYITLLIYMF